MYAEGLQNVKKKDEQWLLEGKCKICRRKDYCKKSCTAYKRAAAGIISEHIREITGADTLRGIMDNGKG